MLVTVCGYMYTCNFRKEEEEEEEEEKEGEEEEEQDHLWGLLLINNEYK